MFLLLFRCCGLLFRGWGCYLCVGWVGVLLFVFCSFLVVFLVVCSCSCYLVCLLGDYGLGCYLYFGVGCGLGCYLFVVGCFGFGLLIGLIGLGCFELF